MQDSGDNCRGRGAAENTEVRGCAVERAYTYMDTPREGTRTRAQVIHNHTCTQT